MLQRLLELKPYLVALFPLRGEMEEAPSTKKDKKFWKVLFISPLLSLSVENV